MLPQNIAISREELLNVDFSIRRINETATTLKSPLEDDVNFIEENECISYYADENYNRELREKGLKVPAFVAAGPRRTIYHDPRWTTAAIVTCGGLCPGLNDVIKGLVNTLYYFYGVDQIYGIRYGYAGLNPDSRLKPIPLDPDVVDTIDSQGGTILGSSRGSQDVEEIVKAIDRLKINILFTIGGDGTQRGAHEIAMKCLEHHLRCNVVGIPKTIDNDLNFMDRTFGFETAVQAASNILTCAHNEAKGAYNGIGLVRVMGRDSGFIAAYSALANSLVNFCLIPEVPFDLEGRGGLLEAMEKRMEKKHHAVIVVAEGAGQQLMQGEKLRDKSGNILHNDIGAFLKTRLKQHFDSRGLELTIKYFDPSYEIRSLPANSTDSIFCLLLAQNAVHAAMAGMTDLVVGNWNGYYTYVPIPLATSARRAIDPHGQLWQSVLLTTRQALLMDSQRVK